MKLLKRSKGILRFQTTIGTVSLKEGMNELTKEQLEAAKAHPMFEALEKTSGLVLVAEEKKENPTKPYSVKKDISELELADIELRNQSKKDLISLAESLGVEHEGLNKKDLIAAIELSKESEEESEDK